MKIAVVIGHAHDRRGADSPWLEPEFNFNTDIANYLKELSPQCYDIYFHGGYSKGYSTMIKATANRINTKNYDLVIELHYDASSNASANGCSVLHHYNSSKGKEWALKISEGISKGMNINNRGAIALNKTSNGYLAVAYPNPPAVIIEPFFGGNKSDAQKFDEEFEKRKYAQSIHHTIIGSKLLT